MPMKRGSSRRTIANNISELHSGGTYRQTAKAKGKAAANRQAVAIALRMAGKSRPRKRTIAEGQ